MASVSMTGNDTLILNNYTFVDLADEDVADLTFPDKIAAVKIGKNGNAIYALNEMGKRAELKIRVLRGSADDKFLNGLLLQQQNNFAAFPLMFGEFIKIVGDGAGNITNDTYITSGGVFEEQVSGKSNVSGNTDQSVAIYTIHFANAPRALT